MYNQFNQFYGNNQHITRVHGIDGARAYAMSPNSETLLLDEQNPIVYLKTTDGAGYPTMMSYKIVPFEEPTVNSLEERLKKVEEFIYEQSNSRSAESETV